MLGEMLRGRIHLGPAWAADEDPGNDRACPKYWRRFKVGGLQFCGQGAGKGCGRSLGVYALIQFGKGAVEIPGEGRADARAHSRSA